MATMAIRMPDDKHERLKQLAEKRGLSLNKLIEEWSAVALAEFDTECRFRFLAAKGDAKKAIRVLDKLDGSFKKPRAWPPGGATAVRKERRKVSKPRKGTG